MVAIQGQEDKPAKVLVWMRLALWSVSAIVIFRLIDTSLYMALYQHWPPLALLPDLRLSSLIVLSVAYAASDVVVRLRTRWPDARTWRLVGVWLVGAFVVVHFVGVGKVPLPRWQDQVAFVFTGAIAEELLCRGLVLGAALAIWPSGWKAVAWSASTFALMHVQYHGFRLQGLALAQLAWTLPQGALFATVAMRTRSLTVVCLLHIANNGIVLLA